MKFLTRMKIFNNNQKYNTLEIIAIFNYKQNMFLKNHKSHFLILNKLFSKLTKLKIN